METKCVCEWWWGVGGGGMHKSGVWIGILLSVCFSKSIGGFDATRYTSTSRWLAYLSSSFDTSAHTQRID